MSIHRRTPTETAAAINESEWSTAKPGKPAILPPESDEATGGWKAASGPLPAVVENTKPPATMRAERPKPIEPAPDKAAPVEVARKPSWTPERPGKQSQRTAELVGDAITHVATASLRVRCQAIECDLHSTEWPMLRHCPPRRPLAG